VRRRCALYFQRSASSPSPLQRSLSYPCFCPGPLGSSSEIAAPTPEIKGNERAINQPVQFSMLIAQCRPISGLEKHPDGFSPRDEIAFGFSQGFATGGSRHVRPRHSLQANHVQSLFKSCPLALSCLPDDGGSRWQIIFHVLYFAVTNYPASASSHYAQTRGADLL